MKVYEKVCDNSSFSSFFFLYFKMGCWSTNAEIEMSYHLNRFSGLAPKTGFEPESKSNSEKDYSLASR